MLTFKMLVSIKFDRELDLDKDYIRPGGFNMMMDGKEIEFDFNNSEYDISSHDPCIMEAIFSHPDTKSFEAVNDITEQMLRNITEIKEFFIYIDRDVDGKRAVPVSIEELAFEVDRGDEFTTINVPMNVLKGHTTIETNGDTV